MVPLFCCCIYKAWCSLYGAWASLPNSSSFLVGKFHTEQVEEALGTEG